MREMPTADGPLATRPRTIAGSAAATMAAAAPGPSTFHNDPAAADPFSAALAADGSPAASPLRRARKGELAAYALGGAPGAASPGGMLLDSDARVEQMVRVLSGPHVSQVIIPQLADHHGLHPSNPCTTAEKL